MVFGSIFQVLSQTLCDYLCFGRVIVFLVSKLTKVLAIDEKFKLSPLQAQKRPLIFAPLRRGGRARFNAPDLKSDVGSSLPGVRIPPSPPYKRNPHLLRVFCILDSKRNRGRVRSPAVRHHCREQCVPPQAPEGSGTRMLLRTSLPLRHIR